MKSLFTLGFILSIHISFSQSLLVNGDFEDINICTVYRVECAPEAWISSNNGFANYFKDPRRAHSGINFMAIEAGHFIKEYSRTFIRSRLLCGLRKGATYSIEFYMKSAHEVLDSIGIWFTANDPLFEKTPFYKITPSLYLNSVVTPMNIIDSAWHKIVINYTGTGEERFVAFGFFSKNDFVGERVHPLENRYFVFFDDIEMNPVDPNERLCVNWKEIKEEIYDENERHQVLEKKIRYYKTNPPPPTTVIKNSYLKVDTLIIPDLLFATGQATLQPQSYSLLDSFSRQIKNNGIDSIVIEGHTDSIGSYALNEKLSLDRALAVSNWIKEKTGIQHFIVRGWAFLKPVADNKTPVGRQKNRRVEVFLYIRE